MSETLSIIADRASSLLADLDSSADICPVGDHPALSWRRSGLMAVTGQPDGPGLVCPAAFTLAADTGLAALGALAPGAALPLNGALLLGERARLMGLKRRGHVSANGSCHLLDAADGVFALNLARDDDWGLISAWLEEDAPDWPAIERAVRTRSAGDLVARGIELGLPIALDRRVDASGQWFVATEPVAARRMRRTPLVVDFASLWAGPLAASLLGMVGAHVVKVESSRRPDGARMGHAGFFDLLNGGKKCVAVDFSAEDERQALRELVASADIVIEGSRPRALAQLGIDAAAAVAAGTIWVSITGHGRAGAAAERVGFGDDAAVAAGLASVMADGWGKAMFAGDAMADPLTGLFAALAAWATWRAGTARLIDLSLAGTTGHVLSQECADRATLLEWQAMAERDAAPLYPLRQPMMAAASHGQDTLAVLASC